MAAGGAAVWLADRESQDRGSRSVCRGLHAALLEMARHLSSRPPAAARPLQERDMRLPVVVLLLLAPYALAATPSCTPSQSVFALTDASAPSCLGIEMGNQWSRIVVDQQANCSYSVLGNSAQLDQPETAVSAPHA